MPYSVRRESLQILRGGELPPPPPPEEYRHLVPDSPDAIAYFHSLKPQRFAALARAMDEVLKRKQAACKLIGRTSLSNVHDPWKVLRAQSLLASLIAINQTRKTPAYRNAAAYNKVAEVIFPKRTIDLDVQLSAGEGTSSASMLTLLRNAPRILASLSGTNYDVESTMRQSVGLPWRIAMISVRQLVDIQEELAVRTSPRIWEKLQSDLDPADFKLQPHEGGGASLSYHNFGHIAARAGYADLSEPENPDSLSYNGPVIGCPITLLGKRLHQEWEQYIDTVVTNRLWENAGATDRG